VDASKANKKVGRLTTQGQFIALLYAQLAGSESLRAIEAGRYRQSLQNRAVVI